MNRRFNIWLPLIFALVLIMGIQIGRWLSNASQFTALSTDNSTDDFDQVLNYVKAKYVDTVNTNTLEQKAIEYTLEQLDPHSTFIPASDMEDVNSQMEGNFEGIGVEFYMVNDTIMVINVISGGPSDQAGVYGGDRIITINDTTVAGKNIHDEDVIHKLRGPKGTKVKIGVKRNSNKDLLYFTLTRDKIPLNSIDAAYMIDDKTGCIKINRFSETTYDEFKTALDKLNAQGMKQLVIDLRENGGGLLDIATDIIDQLLPDSKLMVYTQGRVSPRADYKTHVKGKFESGPLAVLIDEGSASASEILAGAMQDWDRGIIVGRRSFGKGLVQQQYGLKDGAALRLTIAKYYTPSGRCIQKSYSGGFEKYYHEVLGRYENGEVSGGDSTQQADTTKYFTANHRVVYGGGGITPDVFVPLDTTGKSNQFLNEVLNSGLIQEFTYSYYQDHRQQFNFTDLQSLRKSFHVGDDIYGAFVAAAKKSVKNASDAEVAAARAYICTRIKAFLAREKFGPDAFYAVLNDDDATMQKALDEMQSANSILAGK